MFSGRVCVKCHIDSMESDPKTESKALIKNCYQRSEVVWTYNRTMEGRGNIKERIDV